MKSRLKTAEFEALHAPREAFPSRTGKDAGPQISNPLEGFFSTRPQNIVTEHNLTTISSRSNIQVLPLVKSNGVFIPPRRGPIPSPYTASALPDENLIT
ncbi:hypothetical protein ACKLNR_008592 [Fusarium oxysporum f. sp. zingiberi]